MKCKKKIPLAKNGNERGVCNKEVGHQSQCGNGTCRRCGVKLSKRKVRTSRCSLCSTEISRERRGSKPKIYQIPGEVYTFPCGCFGVLPRYRGESNQFGRWNSRLIGFSTWACRADNILQSSRRTAKKRGYEAISLSTPHTVIRQMMEVVNCVLCGQQLDWSVFGRGTTPHLHHDHITGEIHGFAHPKCNPLALQRHVWALEAKIFQLENKGITPVLKQAA